MKKQGKRSNQHKLIIVFSLSCSLLYVTLLLTSLVGELLVEDTDNLDLPSVRRASTIDSGSFVYPYYIALDSLFSIGRYDLKDAEHHFRMALRRYPLHLYSWYGLARTYYETGNRDEGNLLFDQMLNAITINGELAWNSGIFLFVKGEGMRGSRFIAKYLRLTPGAFREVLDLCYRLDIGIRQIYFDVLDERPEYQERLMSYLADRKKIADIEFVWNTVSHDSLSGKVKVKACNSLINDGGHELAEDIWRNISVQKTKKTINNSDFEYGIAGGCYGWHIGRAKGMRTYQDREISVSGMRSLRVEFDGNHNPGVTILRQIVPVDEDGHYSLDAYIRTKDITTTNGLYFSVYGFGCAMKARRSQVFTGTQRWKRVRIEFELPDECNAVMVRLSRDKSRKFNNKIGGTAWVDTVSIDKKDEMD
jgi:hypothetical protein